MIAAEGRLESQGAAALVGDVRMQQTLIEAGLDMAGDAVAETQAVALQSSIQAVQRLTGEVAAAAELASSAEVSAEAQTSAELAVALGTDALATNVALVTALAAEAQASTQVTVEQMRQGLVDAAAGIAAIIERTEPVVVTLPGVGKITLGVLSQLGLTATGSASLSAAAQSAGVQSTASGQATVAFSAR